MAANNPSGTTFCLAPGIYNVTAQIVAKSGQRWIGALGANNARLSILTGNDSTRFLFNCNCPDMVLRNLIIEKFAGQVVDNTNTQDGIMTGDFDRLLVENVESRYNWGANLRLPNGAIVRNSYLHHSRWHGFIATGNNVLVENTDISFNNYRGDHSWNWSAGGSKGVFGSNMVFRNNHVYQNCGPGLWTDNVGTGTVYEGNNIHDNFAPGIMHEISGSATIRNNSIQRNALGAGSVAGCNQGTSGGEQGGILISNSENVELYGNVLVDNDGGIKVRDYDRGTTQEHSINLYAHDNESTYTVGVTGCDDPTLRCRTNSGNRWERNRYHVGADPTPFLHAGAERTFAEWQGFGYDLAGSID